MPRRARPSFATLLLTLLGLGLVLVVLTRVLRPRRPAPAVGAPLPSAVRPAPDAPVVVEPPVPVVEAEAPEPVLATGGPPAPVEQAARVERGAPKKKAAAKKAAAPAKKAATKKKAAPARQAAAWVDPDGNVCPTTHPIKAKLGSKLFHLPGMFAYERTNPDRCYRDEAAAEADGLRRAKR